MLCNRKFEIICYLYYALVMKQTKIYIYGKHALTEALRYAPHAVKKIHIAKKLDDDKLRSLIDKSKIPVASLESKHVSSLEGNATHQGIIGVVAVNELVQSFDAFMRSLPLSPKTSLVILGEVQDPHNVGAVIRSAAAFGVAGVLIPEHNQAPITGAVVKAPAAEVPYTNSPVELSHIFCVLFVSNANCCASFVPKTAVVPNELPF
jgi:23S rRNA (guanosine2251-2'-O)-methyltransferase